MNKLSEMFWALWEKAREEPVAVRAAAAGIVNVLILTDTVNAPFADDVDQVVEGILLAVANLALLFNARAKVFPEAKL